jgi:hypothetical protein
VAGGIRHKGDKAKGGETLQLFSEKIEPLYEKYFLILV